MAQPKRKDKSRVVLRKGEVQRANGTYHYCWTDGKGKRHFVYAKTLEELRDKEAEIEKDKSDGIKAEAKYTTINDLFDLWKQLKRGLKNNTFENYKYMYDTFVRPEFGKTRISSLKKSDVKRFYNRLADDRGLQPSTIDSIHTVLHQVLDMAVDDDYLRSNPSSNVLRELKQSHCFETEKRRGLTKPEQDLFLDFLKRNHTYSHWYPIFAIMVGSGLRVGEITGLRWCDIDLEEGIIDVNHTLVYYAHRDEVHKHGCYYNVNTPKTKASTRQVPMLDFVKEAFIMEREYQEAMGIKCEVTIDGYTDFIFVNRFGEAQNLANLNKAIRRIIRDCNDEEFLKDENPAVLLYMFFNRRSCVDEPFTDRVNRVIIDTMAAKGKIIGIDPIPHISVRHFIAPRGLDLSHYNYIVMDGRYYCFLYIKGNGYPSTVRGGWMSSLINAGEGIDIDVHLSRENRSKTIDKVAQRIRLNRTKLKGMQDTSTDYEELTNSIQAGYYIKNGI